MRVSKESLMYPGVCRWLDSVLRSCYPSRAVIVAEVSRARLKDYIRQSAWRSRFPGDWVAWDVQADVFGMVELKDGLQLALVECKNTRITLPHVSQLLGYSRVVKPRLSFLLSPLGISDALLSLVVTHGRRDVLEYFWETGTLARTLFVARWDVVRETLDQASVLPDVPPPLNP